MRFAPSDYFRWIFIQKVLLRFGLGFPNWLPLQAMFPTLTDPLRNSKQLKLWSKRYSGAFLASSSYVAQPRDTHTDTYTDTDTRKQAHEHAATQAGRQARRRHEPRSHAATQAGRQAHTHTQHARARSGTV